MFTKRSKMLFISALLATAYVIYLICYFGGGLSSTSGTDLAAGVIATALVTPHIICIAVGAIFAWLGFFLKASWGALVGAILYTVGAVLFLAYFFFGVPILVLGFIGYAKQKKINMTQMAQ